MDANPSDYFAVRPRRKRRIGAGVLLLVLGSVSFVAGVMLFLRVGLDDQRLALLVVSQLESTTGTEVSLASAHLSWLGVGKARLSLKSLQVKARSSSGAELTVPRVTVELDMVRLFGGSLCVKLVRFTDPALRLLEEGEGPVEPTIARSPHSGIPPWFSVIIERLEIGGGSVMLVSRQSTKDEGRGILEAIDATLVNATPRSLEHFTVQGIARDGAAAGRFRSGGRIAARSRFTRGWRGELSLEAARCPISPFNAIASNFKWTLPLSHGIVELKCHLKGDSDDLHFSGQGGVSQTTLFPDGYVVGGVALDEARVNLAADLRKNVLRVNVAELQVPGMALSADATFQDVNAKNASMELVVRKGDFDLDKFLPLIPLNLMSEEDRSRFREAGLNGHVVITGGSWRGKVSDIMIDPWRRGTLALDAYVDRVSAFVPGAGLPIKNATGSLRLNADEVVFKGISFTLGTSPIVLNGGITDLRGVPKSDLFVSMSAQAQDLAPVLSNKTVTRQLGSWIDWIEEPQGGVSITLDVKGSVKRPSMRGRVVLENFHCRVPRFPLPLKNINGSLRFRSADVIFSGVKGVVGDSPVEVSGQVSPENTTLSGEGKLNPADLKRMGLSASWEVSGSIPVTLSMKGKNAGTDFSLKADLRGNGVRVGHLVRKEPGASLALETSGTFSADSVVVEDACLITEHARISAKGKSETDGRTTLYVNLPPKGIPTNALIPMAHPSWDLQPGGRVEGDAVIRFDSSQVRGISLDANLVLSHVSALLGFRKRVDGLTGSMRVKGRAVTATIERARIGESEFSGSISISDTSRPRVEIGLNFSFLDTTDFSAPPGYVSPKTWGEWIQSNPAIKFLARSVGTATVKIGKGKTPFRTFADFQAQFEDQNGLIKVPRWHVSFAEGLLQGDGRIDITPNTTTPLALEFQGDHLRMERLFLINPERVRLQGDVTAEGRLEWKTTSRRENNGIYRTGKMEFRVQDGVIYRFEALSKIFSLINLGSLMRGRFPDLVSEGLPFQKLNWTVEVFDDKWKFQDAVLVSDAACVDAYGMYFSSQDRIDFKVKVSPFVGLDAIVSGLFGGLVTKDGKTLSTTFSVRGLPATPDVRLEPFAQFKPDRN
jgi:hypothetical protein